MHAWITTSELYKKFKTGCCQATKFPRHMDMDKNLRGP